MKRFMRRIFSAMHKERTERAIRGKRQLLIRLMEHNPDFLPKHVDTKKLEAAYEAMEGYELVLRKRIPAV